MRKRLGVRQRAKRLLQKAGLYPLASQVMWRIRQAKHVVGLNLRTLRMILDRYRAAIDAKQNNDGQPHGYDVICLPVVPWHSRIQRPQQLMRQFADHGHRVFYTSLHFRRSRSPQVLPVQRRIFEVTLPGPRGANVHQQLPSSHDIERMAAAIDRLRHKRHITSAVIVVQLPFWTALAEKLRDMFGWPIVYDCMDDHASFSTSSNAMSVVEDRLVAQADLVAVTADILHENVREKAQRTVMVRNACDCDHFAATPKPSKRRAGVTVGFYGAIADWFDSDLMTGLAKLRPDWRFELIGSTFTGRVRWLKRLKNVTLLGEKPYAKLPQLVAGWDCHIIPFKRTPLTEATNPVKAYEMLATGKPLVAVDLPELRPMARDGLLTLADDAAGFAKAIEQALAHDSDLERDRRRAFAVRNTWQERFNVLERAIVNLFPLASIVIVTYNNLRLNQACLQSIFLETDYPNYEVIVVDNGSSDGTAEWLDDEASREPRLTVIHNSDNRGFSAANNQGLRAARGEFLCLLNNDTIVAQGWLATLINHLRVRPDLGLVGPVSNQVGNEAKVPVGYKNIDDMPVWAEAYCRQHDGETAVIGMLAFFCVVLSRAVYEQTGELDERFGLGYFEDDDYCLRVRTQGYHLRFARDAFVHHWQGATFELLGEGSLLRIHRENRQKYETKWNVDSLAETH